MLQQEPAKTQKQSSSPQTEPAGSVPAVSIVSDEEAGNERKTAHKHSISRQLINRLNLVTLVGHWGVGGVLIHYCVSRSHTGDPLVPLVLDGRQLCTNAPGSLLGSVTSSDRVRRKCNHTHNRARSEYSHMTRCRHGYCEQLS